MEYQAAVPSTVQPQACLPTHDASISFLPSRYDEWTAYKDRIFEVYIQQKNTLKATIQIIEAQGGPKASERTWKSKLKEWDYEKNLSSNDMSILCAKAKRRKHEDGKETTFYHFDSEISPDRIERFKKTTQLPESASPSADTPVNVRYHTPRPAQSTVPAETHQDHHATSFSSFDLLPNKDAQAFNVGHHCVTPPIVESAYEMNTRAGIERIGLPTQNTEAVNIRAADKQHDLHSMPDKVLLIPTVPFLQPCPTRDFPQDYDELWVFQNFDRGISSAGIDLSQHTWDEVGFGDLDSLSSRHPSSTPTLSSSEGGIATWALINIPWFRFREVVKTSIAGILGQKHGMNKAGLLSAPDLHKDCSFTDPAHDDTDLKERCRLLSIVSCSLPNSKSQHFLPELSSKLQELIPESFVGETRSKLQILFHPSNDSPLQELMEFASYFLSNNTSNEKQTLEFLNLAITKGSKELFRSLFAIKTPTVDALLEKILESISRAGNAKTLQLMIDCGLDVLCLAGMEGGRYLQLSLYYSKIDVAKLLLDYGADVNPPLSKVPYDLSPLCRAIKGWHEEIIGRLLELGANVNTNAAYYSPLPLAVYLCEGTNVVRQLLQAGADVDHGDIGGCDILDWAYIHRPDIYQMMSPMSQIPKTALTVRTILSAASNGKQVLFEYLEEKDDHRREKLEEALWFAVSNDQASRAISVLLEFGVDPNTATVNTSQSPLYLAATRFNMDLVERLLNAGAKIDSSGALEAVAQYEEGFDTMNFLIEQGANLLALGNNALRKAISGNNLAGIKLLMRSGVDINDATLCEDGYTHLASAARFATIKTVRYLIDNGALINGPSTVMAGTTALQAAAARGDVELVKFLLSIGADVNAAPSLRKGMTALEASLESYKLEQNHTAIFELLLDSGADINGPRERRCKKWNSALVTLITRRASSHLIDRALKARADVNRLGKGEGARTPLQAASEEGNLDLVKQLLEKGAVLNAPPSANHGRNALQAACSGEIPSLELVQYLLKEGAEVNAAAGIKRGLTAFQGAAIQGHIKIALALLDAGAEVNAEIAEIEGRTPLDGAAEHGRLDMVHFLLNLGAKSEAPGNTGYDNAIKLAKKNGHFAVARLLEARSTS